MYRGGLDRLENCSRFRDDKTLVTPPQGAHGLTSDSSLRLRVGGGRICGARFRVLGFTEVVYGCAGVTRRAEGGVGARVWCSTSAVENSNQDPSTGSPPKPYISPKTYQT